MSRRVMVTLESLAPAVDVSSIDEAFHTARATAKLRIGQLYAGELMVFIRANPFRASVPQYSRSASVSLVSPTQGSRVITRQAMTLLRSLYREGFGYAKAGVMLPLEPFQPTRHLLEESFHHQPWSTSLAF